MLQPFTYLLINFFTIIICFVASFDRRVQFHRYFPAFLKAALIVGIPFIIWDILFTQQGVWWFNTSYTIGSIIGGLPLEEWLFFICIPFSCAFTYHCFTLFFNLSWANAFNNIIVFASTVVAILVALLYTDRLYTLVTALALLLSMVYLHFIARKHWIGQASLVYLVLMLGFFPVNGILTGTGLESPIVNYNTKEILNIRMLTIPVEDAVYGYTQFLWLIYFFNLFKRKNMKTTALKFSTPLLALLLFFSSCNRMPSKAKPVSNFYKDRYLGTWFELARFDYRFERNLDNTVAKCSLNPNGTIRVENSGFNVQSKKWKSATGSARFRSDTDIAALKVTFFKPFYAGYNVIAIDRDYTYALVAGRNLNYLWILSRQKTIPAAVRKSFLDQAAGIGYDTTRLIWVKQDKDNPYVQSK
jgi:lycopene cyclase domain-containing protein